MFNRIKGLFTPRMTNPVTEQERRAQVMSYGLAALINFHSDVLKPLRTEDSSASRALTFMLTPALLDTLRRRAPWVSLDKHETPPSARTVFRELFLCGREETIERRTLPGWDTNNRPIRIELLTKDRTHVQVTLSWSLDTDRLTSIA